jgi:cell division protein FtsB
MPDARRRERPNRPRAAPSRGARSRNGPGRVRPGRAGTRQGSRPARVGSNRVAAAAPARERSLPSDRVRRRRRLLVGLVGSLALVGFLFVFVYPTRTYLSQREQISRADERLAVLRRQTQELQRDTRRLQGDAEVERIAREQYGLVRPGETPYVLVPETPTTTAPAPETPAPR